MWSLIFIYLTDVSGSGKMGLGELQDNWFGDLHSNSAFEEITIPLSFRMDVVTVHVLWHIGQLFVHIVLLAHILWFMFIAWYCVVLHDISWYFMVLICIDTVELILSDWSDTGAGTNEKVKKQIWCLYSEKDDDMVSKLRGIVCYSMIFFKSFSACMCMLGQGGGSLRQVKQQYVLWF